MSDVLVGLCCFILRAASQHAVFLTHDGHEVPVHDPIHLFVRCTEDAVASLRHLLLRLILPVLPLTSARVSGFLLRGGPRRHRRCDPWSVFAHFS